MRPGEISNDGDKAVVRLEVLQPLKQFLRRQVVLLAALPVRFQEDFLKGWVVEGVSTAER